MATAAKIDNKKLEKYLQNRTAKRIPKKKPPRRYYLIICEGVKTEPNYFESLKKKLPPEIVHRVDVSGQGKNCLSLLKSAEEEVEKRYSSNKPPYYFVWLVFDKDSFNDSDFDNTIKKANAKRKQKWHCAWSNQAFELWYLLHFDTHSSAIHRVDYQNKIEDCMGKMGIVNRKYKKNAEDMYDLLEPLQGDAIQNARIAYKAHEASVIPSKMNPATTVHLLVEELIRYID